MNIIPVIMAGGNGSRLWPLSRKAYPKQFLSFVGEHTLIQETCFRAQALSSSELIVICNEQHKFICAAQLRTIQADYAKIILEPTGKNTAPAIALAAEYINEHYDNAVMVVMSADHYIEDRDYFANTINYACEFAHQQHIITLGITPSHPETGYGYLKKGTEAFPNIYQVEQFVEKPNQQKAIEYLEESNYLWNSGMFIMLASAYLNELEKFEAGIKHACQQAMQHAKLENQFIYPCTQHFSQSPNDSIDYAVMEKTDKCLMLEFNSKWSDIGAWSSLWELAEKDNNGNYLEGNAVTFEAKNNYIHSNEKPTSILGADNLIVIDTKDSLLIADRSRVQEIKQIVQYYETAQPALTENHRQVARPWGHYDSIGSGERYQVKLITVQPNEKLSVQMHYHRAEHWIVVKGTAHVTVDEKESIICENQSVYIPVGAIHCLENKGKIPLELIEVQSGTYLGEDDIVRFTDIYGRVGA